MQGQQQQRKRKEMEPETGKGTKKARTRTTELPPQSRVSASAGLLHTKHDQNIVAEGLVSGLSCCNSVPRAVSFTLLPPCSIALSSSSDASDALKVTLCGKWSEKIISEGNLKDGSLVVLLFKQSIVSSYPGDADATVPPSLVFKQGCEIWIQQDSAAEGKEVQEPGWIRLKLFKEAKKEEEKGIEAAKEKPLLHKEVEESEKRSTHQLEQPMRVLAPQAKEKEPSESFQVDLQQPFGRREALTVSVSNPFGPPNLYRYLTCIAWRTERQQQIASFIATVKDANKINRSARGASTTFHLIDPTTDFEDYLSCTYMRQDADPVPQLSEGDIILLRGGINQPANMGSENMKVTVFYDKWAEMATWKPPSNLQRAPKRDELELFPGSVSLAQEEMAYMYRLAHWYRSREVVPPAVKAPKSEGSFTDLHALTSSSNVKPRGLMSVNRMAKKFKRLEELSAPESTYDPNAFFDCIVEVIDCLPPQDEMQQIQNDRYMIGISDYTENQLFREAGEVGVLPPHNRYVMSIAIFVKGMAPTLLSYLVQHLSTEGALVYIKNCRVKHNKYEELEGHIGCKSDISVVTLSPKDENVRELLERKRQLREGSAGDGGEAKHPIADDSGYDSLPPVSTSPASSGIPDHAKDDPPSPSLRVPKPTHSSTLPPCNQVALREQKVAKAPLAKPPVSTAPVFKKSIGDRLNLRRIKDLEEPDGVHDFCNIACEIARKPYYDPQEINHELLITDWTCNELLPENSMCKSLPAEKMVMRIEFWDCPDHFSKVKDLIAGRRIIMKNVRIKSDRYGFLEGTVGGRNRFEILKLDKKDPKWAAMEEAKNAFMARVHNEDRSDTSKDGGPEKQSDSGAGIKVAVETCGRLNRDAEEADAASRSQLQDYRNTRQQVRPGFDGVVCKAADHNIDEFFGTDTSQGMWRLKGRVVGYEPANPLEWMTIQCRNCQTYLTRTNPTCEACREVCLEQNYVLAWQFGLSIEVEPKGADIERDEVDPSRVIQVVVYEPEGATTFMNRLEPDGKPMTAAQAKSYIEKLHPSSMRNGMCPIFDFAIIKASEQDPAFLFQTALTRKDGKLPW